jgi:hypothetical protein
LFVLFIFGISAGAFSQDIGTEPLDTILVNEEENPKMNLKDRLFFGGNLGAQFGNYTYVNVSPLGGIKLTDQWSFGSQVSYSYVNINYSNYRYEDHIIGASLFSRYFIFKNIFTHVETEALNGDWKGTGERFNVNSLFVGGGYMYRIGDKAGFGITGMINLLQSTYSPYQNPIINAGFTYDL